MLKVGVMDTSIILELVLHTSYNLGFLIYASPIFWRGFLLFLKESRLLFSLRAATEPR